MPFEGGDIFVCRHVPQLDRAILLEPLPAGGSEQRPIRRERHGTDPIRMPEEGSDLVWRVAHRIKRHQLVPDRYLNGVCYRIGPKGKDSLCPAIGIGCYLLNRGLPTQHPLTVGDRKGDFNTWKGIIVQISHFNNQGVHQC